MLFVQSISLKEPPALHHLPSQLQKTPLLDHPSTLLSLSENQSNPSSNCIVNFLRAIKNFFLRLFCYKSPPPKTVEKKREPLSKEEWIEKAKNGLELMSANLLVEYKEIIASEKPNKFYFSIDADGDFFQNDFVPINKDPLTQEANLKQILQDFENFLKETGSNIDNFQVYICLVEAKSHSELIIYKNMESFYRLENQYQSLPTLLSTFSFMIDTDREKNEFLDEINQFLATNLTFSEFF